PASSALPYHYTVGSHEHLEDEITIPKDHKLAFTLYGPDGYIRKLSGSGPTELLIEALPKDNGDVALHFHNRSSKIQTVHISDDSYGQDSRILKVDAGSNTHIIWPLDKSHHWYDLQIKTETHTWRLAGHVENGEESWSDPANKSPVLL
ncbi:phospholipase C, phosphocholine-specific, partial [Acidithiobacillus marinus]